MNICLSIHRVCWCLVSLIHTYLEQWISSWKPASTSHCGRFPASAVSTLLPLAWCCRWNRYRTKKLTRRRHTDTQMKNGPKQCRKEILVDGIVSMKQWFLAITHEKYKSNSCSYFQKLVHLLGWKLLWGNVQKASKIWILKVNWHPFLTYLVPQYPYIMWVGLLF